MYTRAPRRRAGFGLIELLLGITILSIFLGSLALSSSSMLKMGLAADVKSQAEQVGATTLLAILDDLRLSGDAGPYPYLFTAGVAENGFELHSHVPADEHAQEGDEDFGPDRELVFLHPADENRDGKPDFDADGDLLWGPTEISYVLVTAPDGVNELQRRLDGVRQRTLARHVERVVFDDITTSGFEVPLASIRVRVWFRLPDGNGGFLRHRVEATVGLRNRTLGG